jgi:SAM-dependent methyltransferase
MSNASWSDFWESGQAEAGCGGSATRWNAIEAAQGPVWQRFARTLPKGARVVDLATGNGVVMGWLAGARRDLKLVGVDLAPRIPAPPKGTRSIPGVAMEALPFRNSSQDAVVSRFGVEYGDVPKAAAEISRVLKSGGRVVLMTHRIDGPILAHNIPRRAGLRWALEEADLIGKARASLQLRRLGLKVAPALAQAPAEAANRFGQGSAAWEFAEAVVQTLRLGWQDSDAAILEVLATLKAKADNEVGRIDSLENACRVAANSEGLDAAFVRNGLQLEAREQICEANQSQPFADVRFLSKRSTAG